MYGPTCGWRHLGKATTSDVSQFPDSIIISSSTILYQCVVASCLQIKKNALELFNVVTMLIAIHWITSRVGTPSLASPCCKISHLKWSELISHECLSDNCQQAWAQRSNLISICNWVKGIKWQLINSGDNVWDTVSGPMGQLMHYRHMSKVAINKKGH